MRRWLKSISIFAHVHGFFEQRCPVCHLPYSPDGDTRLCCAACRAALAGHRNACARCGYLLETPSMSANAREDGCLYCYSDPPPWNAFYSVGIYEGLLRELVIRAKYGGERPVCRLLGALLGEVCAAMTDIDAIIPMPLHKIRLRQRGFNQCHEMARSLSLVCKAPSLPHLVERVAPTSRQTGLRRADRLRNLRGAFKASLAVRGMRLLLIDDTMTTGVSLRRVANCLLEAGAASVSVAVVAVTPLRWINLKRIGGALPLQTSPQGA